MAEKSHYNYRVEPQDVDFTLRATIPSLGSAILNTAGVDAHGKGFGADALNADNHPWVPSRMAVEFDSQPTTLFYLRSELLFYDTFPHEKNLLFLSAVPSTKNPIRAYTYIRVPISIYFSIFYPQYGFS